MIAPVDVLADYIVTYRDTYGVHRTFTVTATSNDEATELAAAWKGSAPIAIVSVREVTEFPRGEFPPQANVGGGK